MTELPAAHILQHGPSGTHVRRYWQPDPEHRLPYHTQDEYYEAFRCLLAEATEGALRSNSPVWADLSGGLDSSSITATAARLVASGRVASQGLAAFSLVASRTARSDESVFQRELLACYKLEWHRVDIDEYPSFSIDEPPSSHPCKASVYRPITDASRRLFESHGVRVHLTGVGGDNIFCGDLFPPLYLSDLARRLKWANWWRELNSWAQRGDRSYWNLLWHCSRGKLADFYAGAPKGDIPKWLADRFREEVRAADSEPWAGGPRLFASSAREVQWRSIRQTAAIVRHIRVQDERRPLLFRPLVEFTLALPWRFLLTPQEDRVIQREGLKTILPDAIRLRTTKASGTPLLLRGLRENWMRMKDVAEGRRLAELDLVTPAAFRDACERLRHGVLADQLRYLVGALSLEMWLGANADHLVGITETAGLDAGLP